MNYIYDLLYNLLSHTNLKQVLLFLVIVIFLIFIFSISKAEEGRGDGRKNLKSHAAIVNYVLKHNHNKYVSLCRKKITSEDFEKDSFNKGNYLLRWHRFKCPTLYPYSYSLFVNVSRYRDGSYKVEISVIRETAFGHRGLGEKYRKIVQVDAKKARKILG